MRRKCLLQGAMDYLLKGFIDPRTLIAFCARRFPNATPWRDFNDLLPEPATGLYTRDGLLTLGSHFQEEAEHTGGTLVLICVFFENLDTLRDGWPGCGGLRITRRRGNSWRQLPAQRHRGANRSGAVRAFGD